VDVDVLWEWILTDHPASYCGDIYLCSSMVASRGYRILKYFVFAVARSMEISRSEAMHDYCSFLSVLNKTLY
jgi:hypothetical protein